VNCDTILNVQDIVSIVNHILGNNPITDECNLSAADYNNDTIVNVVDIISIVNEILGNVARAEGTCEIENNTLHVQNVGGLQVNGNLISSVIGNDIVASKDGLTIVYNMNGLLETSSFTFDNTDEIIAVDGSASVLDVTHVDGFSIKPAYPNPFNPTTTISLTLDNASDVSIKVYNVMGELVSIIAEGNMSANVYHFNWDASNVSSGVYFISTQVENVIKSQRVMLLK
jgi:hypothetical protein